MAADACIDYAALQRPLQEESLSSDSDSDEDEELIKRGRISSAQLYHLGPVTGDRAYNVLKARQDNKQQKQQEDDARKRQRIEDTRAAEQELAKKGQELDVSSEDDVRALTVANLRAWLLVKTPSEWNSHRKLKAKADLVSAALVVFRSM